MLVAYAKSWSRHFTETAGQDCMGLPKPKGAICLMFKIKHKVSADRISISRSDIQSADRITISKIKLLSRDRIFDLQIELLSRDWITTSRSNIRSADQITILRLNIRSADRILRSHDATGSGTMKTIKLHHNKPSKNNSNNLSHFEKKKMHSISLFVINQTISFLNQSMTLSKKLSFRYSA